MFAIPLVIEDDRLTEPSVGNRGLGNQQSASAYPAVAFSDVASPNGINYLGTTPKLTLEI